jgi:hypothetical protein
LPGSDGDGGDHLAVAQPEMLPRAPGVGGLVHPVADGEIGRMMPAPVPT